MGPDFWGRRRFPSTRQIDIAQREVTRARLAWQAIHAIEARHGGRFMFQKDDAMVAKINGLSRLGALVKDLNDKGGSAADALADKLQSAHDRITAGIALASQNVDAVTATADGLDAFNATFGNGGPPLESAASSTSAAPAAEPAAEAAPAPAGETRASQFGQIAPGNRVSTSGH